MTADKTHSFSSVSGRLHYSTDIADAIIRCTYQDLKIVTNDEYKDYIFRLGKVMETLQIGKVYLDISSMKNFGLGLRAVALANINDLMIKKAPFFVIAIRKGNSAFENLATQTALNSGRKLSKKFLDGRMFEDEAEALEWLRTYPTNKNPV